MNDTITPAELKAKLNKKMAVQLLDVRRKTDIDSEPAMIPGATWHDPAEANTWADDLNSDREVIIYCARGGLGQQVHDGNATHQWAHCSVY